MDPYSTKTARVRERVGVPHGTGYAYEPRERYTTLSHGALFLFWYYYTHDKLPKPHRCQMTN